MCSVKLKALMSCAGPVLSLLVPIPDKVAGERYAITLTRAGDKAGFISGVRLLGKEKGAEPSTSLGPGPPPDPKAPAHRIALKLAVKALPTGPPQGEAFPEMRKVWDTPHPPPATPPKAEAAFRLAEKNGRLANEMFWRCRRFVEGWLGDGNSARTAIMYALWKTQGITLQPWRADVRVGAVLLSDSEARGTRDVARDPLLCISVVAEKPWEGRLVFDKPRHKLHMHMPLDYPRINQFPEWFVAEADRRYTVRNLTTDKESVHAGKELQDGIPVSIDPSAERRLAVFPK